MACGELGRCLAGQRAVRPSLVVVPTIARCATSRDRVPLHRATLGAGQRARPCSIAAFRNTSRPGSPNAATASLTTSRCRRMWSGSSAATSTAASSPAVSPARCGQCGHDFLIAFSCKGRGVCPSCNARRKVATAAHLTDHVLPDLPLRQWVLAVPKRLCYFLERDADLQGAALRRWGSGWAAHCACRHWTLASTSFPTPSWAG